MADHKKQMLPRAHRHAHGVTPGIKRANLHRLKRIEGQVRGLQQMVQDDRYCPDILIQVAAVREALAALRASLLQNHLENCLTHALRGGGKQAVAMQAEFMKLIRQP